MGIHATNARIWQKKNTDVSIRTTDYEHKYVQTNEQNSQVAAWNMQILQQTP